MRLLIADDDNDDIELFQEAIVNINPGVEVIAAHNCRNLLLLLHSTKPDAIFLDINMPEMSGWECLKVIKNDDALKNLPVVIYTTSSSKRDKEIAKELGAWRFITKPDKYSELMEILALIVKQIGSKP